MRRGLAGFDLPHLGRELLPGYRHDVVSALRRGLRECSFSAHRRTKERAAVRLKNNKTKGPGAIGVAITSTIEVGSAITHTIEVGSSIQLRYSRAAKILMC